MLVLEAKQQVIWRPSDCLVMLFFAGAGANLTVLVFAEWRDDGR